jgi:tetratricopeptide (TPR) repeat protein
MSKPPSSSQALWTRGEALERAGQVKEALDLYIKAAVAEEDARRPLRARLLWEQIARRTGISGMLLERLASVSGRARLEEDAFDYWVAAAARFDTEGHRADADRAKAHALDLRKRLPGGGSASREKPPLVQEALQGEVSFVRELLAPPAG